jgi:hypothetical protein
VILQAGDAPLVTVKGSHKLTRWSIPDLRKKTRPFLKNCAKKCSERSNTAPQLTFLGTSLQMIRFLNDCKKTKARWTGPTKSFPYFEYGCLVQNTASIDNFMQKKNAFVTLFIHMWSRLAEHQILAKFVR